MNRWMQRIITFASITSALALVPAGVAFAQDGTPQTGEHAQQRKGGHRKGLVGAALKLESLTPDQRTEIEQLAAQRRAAARPVRQADAQVLEGLAQQVSAAKMDVQALGPSLAVERGAVAQERNVDAATLSQLHSILTPAQRTELVDRIEARVAKGPRGGEGGAWRGGGKLGLSEQQREQVRSNLQASRPTGTAPRGEMRAALESFKGDAFDAAALAHPADPGARAVRLTQAMLPVLTPNQRATYADMLRHRAEHATSPKKA
jgi:Spy/CpxP family protein refolding chaperone